jgi:Homeodomain-like domain
MLGRFDRSSQGGAERVAVGAGGGDAADGVSQREIAGRLGINRRTVSRMVASDEPPHDRRRQGGARCSIRSSGCCGGCSRSGRPSRRRGSGSCARATATRARSTSCAGACSSSDRRASRSAHRLPPRAAAAVALGGTAHPTRDPRSRATRPRARRLLPLLGRAVGALQLRHDARVLSRGPRAALQLARGRSPRVRLRQLALGRSQAGARHQAFYATVCTPETPA